MTMTQRMTEKKDPDVGTQCLKLAAWPLVIYPWLLIGDIMGLSAILEFGKPSVQWVIFVIFVYGSLAYPLVFLICLALVSLLRSRKRVRARLLVSVAPLLWLAFLILDCVVARLFR